MQHSSLPGKIEADQDLKTLARLILPSPELNCAPVNTSTNTSVKTEPSVEQLIHHGICALALENNALSDATRVKAQVHKTLLVASDQFKQVALIELLSELHNAGLSRHLLIKGSAFAHSLYQHPWLRPRTDTDLLIDVNDKQAYQQCFEDLGFEKLFAVEGERVSYQCTYSKPLSKHAALDIDLHWRINNRQLFANSLHFDELFASATPLTALSDKALTLSPPHALLLAIIHLTGHHNKDPRLIWFYDMHQLADSLDTAQWQTFSQLAQERQLSAIAFEQLQRCHQFFTTDIPEQVWRALEHAGKKDEPSKILLDTSLPEWRYFVADLKALKGIKNRLTFVRETFFPDAQYIRARMQTRSALLGHIKRIRRGLRRAL